MQLLCLCDTTRGQAETSFAGADTIIPLLCYTNEEFAAKISESKNKTEIEVRTQV